MKLELINKLVEVSLINGKKIKGCYKNYLSEAKNILIDNNYISINEIDNIRELDDIEKNIINYNNYIEYELRLSPNTIVSYKKDLEKYHDYLVEHNIKEVANIKKENITNYLIVLNNAYGLKTTSIARKLTTIKNFHSFLYQHEFIDIDVSSSIERQKLKKTLPKVMTVEEVDKLLNIELKTIFDYRDKAMLELLYATGLRISELLNLTMNDIDLKNCIIRCMGKGKKERIVPIGEYVLISMNEYLNRRGTLYNIKHDDHLFLNNHGNIISRSGFFKMLKNRLSLCNIHIDVSPHTLRHSFATHMLENGADLRLVQELLGHANINTTRIYTHISDQKVRKDYEIYHPRNKK